MTVCKYKHTRTSGLTLSFPSRTLAVGGGGGGAEVGVSRVARGRESYFTTAIFG